MGLIWEKENKLLGIHDKLTRTQFYSEQFLYVAQFTKFFQLKSKLIRETNRENQTSQRSLLLNVRFWKFKLEPVKADTKLWGLHSNQPITLLEIYFQKEVFLRKNRNF